MTLVLALQILAVLALAMLLAMVFLALISRFTGPDEED